MITIRKSKDRGHFDHGWLDTYHTFSFADYFDPAHLGFRSLRVINEDRIEAGEGFGTHGHRDMEILTYAVEGLLAHKDSMGNGEVIRPGDVQYLSAGTGITHSEFNGSDEHAAKLLQIWIMPDRKGHAPRYGQQSFSAEGKRNRLQLLASGNGEAGSIPVHQDVRLYASILEKGQTLTQPLASGRFAWIQVVRGKLNLNGTELSPGDGAAIEAENTLKLTAGSDESEFLLFDLS